MTKENDNYLLICISIYILCNVKVLLIWEIDLVSRIFIIYTFSQCLLFYAVQYTNSIRMLELFRIS